MRTTFHILFGAVIGVVVAMSLLRHDSVTARLPVRPVISLAERELDRVLPSVNIDDVPFDGAIAEIQKLTPAPITVDWKPLIEYGFDRKTPVTIHGADVLLWQVLERLTALGSRAIGADYPLDYAPRDGGIAIGTANELRQNVAARLYDVRDLVFAAPPIAPGCFGPAPVANATSIDSLAKLVMDNVAPETWRDMGGTIGSIYAANDHLYVVHNWSGQRKIQRLLADLRAANASPNPAIVEKTWSDVRQIWISPDHLEKLEALIRRPIDHVDFEGVSLQEATGALQKMSGVIIAVKWEILAEANVQRTSAVFVKTKDVSLSAVLDLLCAQPIGGVFLGFTIEDGIVQISTREDMSKCTLTRVYDVRDFAAQAMPSERAVLFERLERLIVDTVEPESWRDNGGTIGAITDFQSRLIVTQTWSNQERIAALLDGLRKTGRGLPPTTQPGEK